MLAEQFGKDAAKIERFLKQATREVGQLAVREYVASFKRQSWITEGGLELPWPARKVQRYRRKSGKRSSRLQLTAAGRNDRGRALLVQSGKLRRSIRVASRDGDSVTIGSDSPYARAHNEGSADHHLPQRQFMGATKPLEDAVRTLINDGLGRIISS